MGFSLVFSFLLYTRRFHTANCKKEVKRLKEVERLSKVSPSNQEVVFFFFTFFLCKTQVADGKFYSFNTKPIF